MCIVYDQKEAGEDGLGIEALGINQNKGFVTVDERMRANIPGIWAIGDVTGSIQLAHAASAWGLVAAQHRGRKNLSRRYHAILYAADEIACVGLSEKQAKDKGLDIRADRFDAGRQAFDDHKAQRTGWRIKLVTEARTGSARVPYHGAADLPT